MNKIQKLRRSLRSEDLFGKHMHLEEYYPKRVRVLALSKSQVFCNILEKRLNRSLNVNSFLNIELAKIISLQELPKKASLLKHSRILKGFVKGQVLSAYFKADKKHFPKSHEAFSLLGYNLISLGHGENIHSLMRKENLSIKVDKNFELLSAQWLPYLYEASAISINSASDEVDKKVKEIGVKFLREASELEEGRKDIMSNIAQKSKKVSEERQLGALENISSSLENKKVKPLPIE